MRPIVRIVAGLLFGLHAIADEAEDWILEDALSVEQMRALHSRMDLDKDGKVSVAETMAHALQMRFVIAKADVSTIVDEMDLDRDGTLSLYELHKDMEQWTEVDDQDRREADERRALEETKFNAADVNRDGVLDLEELPFLFYPETHPEVLDVTTMASLRQKDIDRSGELTAQEFWEGDVIEGESLPISDEEMADFKKLDTDASGTISAQELKAWESGAYHTQEAMKDLFRVADSDADGLLTAQELELARERIAGSDAQYHLTEWMEHYEL